MPVPAVYWALLGYAALGMLCCCISSVVLHAGSCGACRQRLDCTDGALLCTAPGFCWWMALSLLEVATALRLACTMFTRLLSCISMHSRSLEHAYIFPQTILADDTSLDQSCSWLNCRSGLLIYILISIASVFGVLTLWLVVTLFRIRCGRNMRRQNSDAGGGRAWQQAQQRGGAGARRSPVRAFYLAACLCLHLARFMLTCR